jgi:NAD(P)-dependent dehydrogenase (short-subunit alcohol dehydrogenase family)
MSSTAERIRESSTASMSVEARTATSVGWTLRSSSPIVPPRIARSSISAASKPRRWVGKMMLAQGGGAIVNIGSNVSPRAIRKRSGYCASKGGVDALTLAMAVDLGPRGIRVNTVAPGYIHTERWETLSEHDTLRRRANVPLGKEASADEVAAAVLFLASDEAAGIHGARLVVDGGCSAQHMPVDCDL